MQTKQTHNDESMSFQRWLTLRKHAYSNVLKILPTKNKNFQIKIVIFFFCISAQNIDCVYSLEPPRAYII